MTISDVLFFFSTTHDLHWKAHWGSLVTPTIVHWHPLNSSESDPTFVFQKISANLGSDTWLWWYHWSATLWWSFQWWVSHDLGRLRRYGPSPCGIFSFGECWGDATETLQSILEAFRGIEKKWGEDVTGIYPKKYLPHDIGGAIWVDPRILKNHRNLMKRYTLDLPPQPQDGSWSHQDDGWSIFRIWNSNT